MNAYRLARLLFVERGHRGHRGRRVGQRGVRPAPRASWRTMSTAARTTSRRRPRWAGV